MFSFKCCCCSLQTGSLIVGVFGMMIGLVALALEIYGSWGFGATICITSKSFGMYSEVCSSPDELERFMSSLFAFLAFWNALEVTASAGLIWGASKRESVWLTGWLMVTVCWIALHNSIAISCILADGRILWLTIPLEIFVLFMCLLSVLTVANLHNEITKISQNPEVGVVPSLPPPPLQMPPQPLLPPLQMPSPPPPYPTASCQPNWYGLPQDMQQPQPTAPALKTSSATH